MNTILRTALSLAAVLSLAAPSLASAAAPVLAETEGEQPGMNVQVRELKRSAGDTVTLKFTIRGESKIGFGAAFADSNMAAVDYNSVGGVHLIDPAAKKKYLVIRDAETNECVCSRNLRSAKALNLWAKFPAPPAEAEMMQVIIPGFPPLDVPLSR